jgi:hypothetical protein
MSPAYAKKRTIVRIPAFTLSRHFLMIGRIYYDRLADSRLRINFAKMRDLISYSARRRGNRGDTRLARTAIRSRAHILVSRWPSLMRCA